MNDRRETGGRSLLEGRKCSALGTGGKPGKATDRHPASATIARTREGRCGVRA